MRTNLFSVAFVNEVRRADLRGKDVEVLASGLGRTLAAAPSDLDLR